MKSRDFKYHVSRRLTQAGYWLTAQVALTAMRLLRLLPADRAINFADRAARKLGPLIGRHRVAIDNLRKAYPEKSKEEIEAIARDMWGNMARLAAEYIFLDSLFDFDVNAKESGRIEVDGIPLFVKIAGEDKPHILFTGHLGNFELLANRWRSLWHEGNLAFQATQQSVHCRVHQFHTQVGDGRTHRLNSWRFVPARTHPRQQRHDRRAGRSKIHRRHSNHLFRAALRDHSAASETRSAIRVRRVPGPLHPFA